MKVYVVFFDDMDNWCIEKVFQYKKDAIMYCEKMNSELPYKLYYYEDREVE